MHDARALRVFIEVAGERNAVDEALLLQVQQRTGQLWCRVSIALLAGQPVQLHRCQRGIRQLITPAGCIRVRPWSR